MFFRSDYCKNVLGGPEEFEVKEFHLHHKSEHTIEGVHFDLEMHIVHMPNEKATASQKGVALASAMGIIFDTKNYDMVDSDQVAAIDAFFDSLKLTEKASTTKLTDIKLSNMMKYVDMNNRWSYKGSLTTPPCSKTVYFNVMRKVWPIKQKYITALQTLMKDHGKGAFFTKADGNHRVV
jgi:carbonic anhydrase